MDEFRNTDLNVSQDGLFPEDHNPITPLPPSQHWDSITPPPFSLEQPTLPLVIRTPLQQRRLTHRVSGPEVFLGEDTSFPSTGPITAVTEATPIAQRSAGTITIYRDTKGRAPMELLMWAIISHIRDHKVLPGGIHISTSLTIETRDELKEFYGEKHGDALDRPLSIQRIPIFFTGLRRSVVICAR